jgi:hypothetical protein
LVAVQNVDDVEPAHAVCVAHLDQVERRGVGVRELAMARPRAARAAVLGNA